MRVLINAFSARQGGGQTYLLNLLQFLPADSDAEVFVLAPESLELPEDRRGIVRLRVDWPVENPFLRAAWERIRLPKLLRELSADVLFCPGGVVGTFPPKGCKTVTMFRNMIPFDLAQRRKYPLGYMRLRNWILHKVMLRSMVQADLVIFISEYARSVIEAAAGGALRGAVVIPHGINPRFRIAPGEKPARPEWLPREGYLLYVSTLDVYKAQIQVVQGFAILKQQRQTKEKLVLAGPENPEYGQRVRAEIQRLGLSGDVIVVGPIPYEELPVVYHHAAINIFASESENCPNILLEALAAERPIVVSNRPPMPEFGGDAAVYFDPASPPDLAEKLAAIIDNPKCMEELSEKAGGRALLYDWSTAARLTWGAIANLQSRKS